MNMNELAKEIHQTAVEHGWWENPPSFPEVIALCHSELSEALEEYRNGRPQTYYPCTATKRICCEEDGSGDYCASRPRIYENPEAPCVVQSKKPEGIAVELADCIIRILDYCGHEGIDIDSIVRAKMDYNKTRPYRHGGKKI